MLVCDRLNEKESYLVDDLRGQDAERDRLRLPCSGDRTAFAWFIDKYKETVFLCCRRLGLREDQVEDVASETFMAAYMGLSRYSGRSELSTWLWSIAYRKGIDCLRKNRRERQLSDEQEQEQEIPAGSGDSPVAAADGAESEQVIWQAVERLPRLWAIAVILHYREGKCVEDIAKIMRTRENTVKTYLFRGRRKLRQMLAGLSGEDSDANK